MLDFGLIQERIDHLLILELLLTNLTGALINLIMLVFHSIHIVDFFAAPLFLLLIFSGGSLLLHNFVLLVLEFQNFK